MSTSTAQHRRATRARAARACTTSHTNTSTVTIGRAPRHHHHTIITIVAASRGVFGKTSAAMIVVVGVNVTMAKTRDTVLYFYTFTTWSSAFIVGCRNVSYPSDQTRLSLW